MTHLFLDTDNLIKVFEGPEEPEEPTDYSNPGEYWHNLRRHHKTISEAKKNAIPVRDQEQARNLIFGNYAFIENSPFDIKPGVLYSVGDLKVIVMLQARHGIYRKVAILETTTPEQEKAPSTYRDPLKDEQPDEEIERLFINFYSELPKLLNPLYKKLKRLSMNEQVQKQAISNTIAKDISRDVKEIIEELTPEQEKKEEQNQDELWKLVSKEINEEGLWLYEDWDGFKITKKGIAYLKEQFTLTRKRRTGEESQDDPLEIALEKLDTLYVLDFNKNLITIEELQCATRKVLEEFAASITRKTV